MERITMKGTGISNTFIHRFLQGGAQHALYKSHTGYALMHHTPACLAETNPPSGQEKGKENLMKIVRLFVTVCKDPEMARFEAKKPLCHIPIWIASDGHARFVVRQLYGRESESSNGFDGGFEPT
jgi:hypothetical protein